MRDHNTVRSEGFLEFVTRILGNERGEVAVGGDGVPRSDAPIADDVPDVTPEPEAPAPAATDAQPGTETEGAPEAGAEPEDPRDVAMRSMEERLEELSKRLEPKGEEQPKKDTTPPLTWSTMNPEQKNKTFLSFGMHVAEKTDETGKRYREVNLDPEAMIDGFINRLSMAIQMANEYTDKTVHGNVSDIRFETVLGGMEKKAGLSDIRQFSDAIKTYLNDRYQPKDHSNPKFIEDGYYWAKGKNLKNAVKKALQSQDRSKTIVRPSTGAAPKAAAKGQLTPETMSQEQKEIAVRTFRDVKPEVAYERYCRLF